MLQADSLVENVFVFFIDRYTYVTRKKKVRIIFIKNFRLVNSSYFDFCVKNYA